MRGSLPVPVGGHPPAALVVKNCAAAALEDIEPVDAYAQLRVGPKRTLILQLESARAGRQRALARPGQPAAIFTAFQKTFAMQARRQPHGRPLLLRPLRRASVR